MKPLKFLLVTCLMILINSVYAQSADVLKFDDIRWVGFDADGEITLFYIEYSKVETNSKTGNVKYSIHGQLDESATHPKKTVKFTTFHQGYICAGDAWYFQYVLTPSGNVGIKCQSWPFHD